MSDVRLFNGIVLVLTCMLQVAFGSAAQAQTIFRPVAIVNDDAITGFDLAQRAQTFTTLGAAAPNPDALRQQALNNLIEEKLKLQAGEAVGIEATQEVVDAGIEEFAQRFGLSGEQLRERLRADGVSDLSINDLVGAEALWREVVRIRFLRRSEPSEAQINTELELTSQAGNTRFRLRELGLKFPGTEEGDAEVRRRISDLYQQLRSGEGFEAAVAEFSESPSAAQGGEIGWVSASALPPEVSRGLALLTIGQVNTPVTVDGGVSLLQLLERQSGGQAATATTPQQREQIRQRLISATITRLADGFLQELRRDALIEIR